MKCRYKVGDCVVYIGDGSYWKVFKILEVDEYQCKYICLAMVNDGYASGNTGHFTNNSPVGKHGIIVDESDYMSYVIAKAL